jgi:uncharacterized membrane protein YfcA
MRRGFFEAAVVVFFTSAIAGAGINQLFSDPARVCEPLAQIGATLLVAYAVQVAWAIQHSRDRGPDRENWVGITTGLGVCALIGVLAALCLSVHEEPLNLLEGLGFAWVVMSIGLLGLWIAIQPWVMYEWTHRFNTEYPDE